MKRAIRRGLLGELAECAAFLAIPLSLLAVVAALTLPGCDHPLDTTEIDAKATDARNRVNELAQSLAETKTPILMFCGLVGEQDEKCKALRTTYEVARAAVVSANRYIDAFAKTGQGAAIVDAGVTVIEAAIEDVKAETERLMQEAGDAVAGVDGRPVDGVDERPEAAAETAEGEGANGPPAPGSDAQKVGPDAGSEAEQTP